MSTPTHAYEVKRTYWVPLTIFLAGVALQPLAWLHWMACVGPSWWMAYSRSGAVAGPADRVKTVCFIAGILLCMAAPFLAPFPLRRKLLLCASAPFVIFVASYLSGCLA